MPADRLAEMFVRLTDTLVTDFDSIDFMDLVADSCVEVLDVDLAGVLLADQHHRLRTIAVSSERARLLELFELQSEQGPSVQCYRSGAVVSVADLNMAASRWPRFAQAALAAGFEAVDALPLRLRERTIGALNLFHVRPRTLDLVGMRVAQALADVATISLLQERSGRNDEVLAMRLQQALHSRIVIEQAKGVLAEHLDSDMDTAFAELRRYARDGGLTTSGAANEIVSGVVRTDWRRSLGGDQD
ncbi:ANTAR domain-containing protein [Kutzneria albida DSM 43870]|uniref:ANTAR domain-containing protein n=2 Tax=Kutzneria TaxID=43356 RepID=W5W4R9_9PSEU|nr:ANTAR domain-containing protein [Kutzneria albida DSM 43870]